MLGINGGKPVREKMLLFGAPNFGDEEINEVVDTLRSGWVSTVRDQAIRAGIRRHRCPACGWSEFGNSRITSVTRDDEYRRGR